MGKTLVRVSCIDQKLVLTSDPGIASGGRNEDVVEFDFCSLWDGFTKTAVFYRTEDAVYHAPVTEDRCIVPHEVLVNEGSMYFGVFGVKDDITRTSEVIRYRVVKGAITTTSAPPAPAPNIYERIMQSLTSLETRVSALEESGGGGTVTPEAVAEAVEDYLEENPVVGEKGDPGVGIKSIKQAPPVNGVSTLTVAYTDGSSSTFQVADGAPGPEGEPGFSPTVTVTRKGSLVEIKATNATGQVSAATVSDGLNGSPGATGQQGPAGKDGASVAVESVTESTADGGSNVVLFTDGKTLTVKNGSKGSTGATGPQGPQGEKGDKGDPGASGVYVGDAAPTDNTANVWINPDSGVAIIPTIEHNTCSIFKKVVCVGDSFTSGHIHTGETAVGTNEDFSWPSFMARLTGNEYVNCGSSGATTITWLTHSRGLTKAKSTGVVQAYLVGLGLNDVNGVGGITLGTAADIGTDAQTYYAGMSRMVRELNAISPKAKIFLQTMASNSGPNMQFNQAIRDVVNAYADTYPVHLLDLEAYLPMYKTDLILGDKINGHYTAIGYQMFAENLRVIWSEYINNHIAEFQDVYTLPYGTT